MDFKGGPSLKEAADEDRCSWFEELKDLSSI